jgi:hypothetical protein
MKCLYLIQSSGKLPEPYNCLKSKDKVLLSHKENTEDTDIFFPNSTWTTGRNKLREYVIQNNLNDYDWYIFLDEDIVFEFSGIRDLQLRQQKGFEECENVLANITNNKLDFQICIPYHPFYWPRAVLPTNGELLTSVGLWFDAMFNCFTKDIFLGNDLFPYDSSYDSVSWWTSQYILMHYCKWHNIKIAQMNSLTVHGTLHSEYPRGCDHFMDVKEKIRIKFTKHFGEIKWNEWCGWSEKQNIDDPDI